MPEDVRGWHNAGEGGPGLPTTGGHHVPHGLQDAGLRGRGALRQRADGAGSYPVFTMQQQQQPLSTHTHTVLNA